MIQPAEDFTARLRSFVRRRVPSSADADDVVQTVMLRLLESKPDADAPSQAWILAAARNAIADHHRARARAGDPLADADPPAAIDQDVSDVAQCLVPLLSRLSEEDRALLERIDQEGGSQTELANEQGVSVTALKSRVQRARARLRDAVLACCEFQRDVHGKPVGPATCRPGAGDAGCGCG